MPELRNSFQEDGTMILRELVRRFEVKCPFSVMLRATLENVLSPDRVNSIFENNAERQSNQTLMFSTVADIMGLVASRMYPSVNAAYKAKLEEAGVTVKAVYDKLQRIEGPVSRAMVRDTAPQLAAIISKMGVRNPEWLRGYRVKILDGNHLHRTERRIKELRTINGAPLPGHAIAVLDPFLSLVIDVFPCEDGHAQERTLLPDVLETVTAGDLWIGDCNFCTTDFLWGIKNRRAAFVIRQHPQNLRPTLIGKRKKIGRTETGMVYEQSMRIADADGNSITIRRITIELDKPTRNGDTEIHILTNLPKRITAIRICELYLKRWAIETAFGEMAINLHGEIETLGYPKAALFGFCMALLAYNLLAIMKAAMSAVHGAGTIKESLSVYYVSDEIAHTYRALEIIPDTQWEKSFANLSAARMAKELIRMAKTVNLSRYRKTPRGPKKEPPTMNKTKRNHVSTARILSQRVAVATC
jgi:hypothetical protein